MASNEKVLAEVGKKITLPCGISTNGEAEDIQWNKDGTMFVKYNKMVKLYSKGLGKVLYRVAYLDGLWASL